MLIFVLLSACSVKQTKIGPIGDYSCKPYYCRGSWHYPQNYYEYCETGLASWYGPGFHGNPKPYGEKFDMHGISAAHRTLPLPSVVRVTNLSNNKSIDLVIDDRGPFTYKGRIIDLSMGAAKCIGIYQKGTAKVKVESLPEQSLALSNYLAKNGNKRGKMKDGRTWQKVYYDEICGNRHPKTNIHNQFENPVTKNSKKTQSKKIVKINDINNKKYFISLNNKYKNKNQAQLIASGLPKTWNAKIIANKVKNNTTYYTVGAGPFDNATCTNVLKKCKQNGFKSAKIQN